MVSSVRSRARGSQFAASKLASGDDLPLMVVESEEGTPEFFNPCDTFKLCASHGNFSVEDDREKVNTTLSTMIANKGASFEKIGDVTLARLVHVFAPVFVPREGGAAAQPAAFPREPGETAVAALKRRLKWRDEATEAAWIADTGLNLLILACCYDDLDAVNELIVTPEKQALFDGIGKTCNALNQAKVKEGDGPHRKAPMNLCTMQCARQWLTHSAPARLPLHLCTLLTVPCALFVVQVCARPHAAAGGHDVWLAAARRGAARCGLRRAQEDGRLRVPRPGSLSF